MDEKRGLLRHYLAAIAYRLQKALRGAPPGFQRFRAAPGVRTPHELVCHIANVLGYSRSCFAGETFDAGVPTDWNGDLSAVHQTLEDLAAHLTNGTPLGAVTEAQLLQGPFADAMTHIGQLAMLRRFFGAPVRPEDFILAAISADNLSQEQPEPVSPDEEWPLGRERPLE
jgi:hypothetical protein